MPSRRNLLRTCGVGLLAGFAGCLGAGGPEGSGTTTRTPGETTRTPDGADLETTDLETTTVAPPPELREVDPAAISDRGVPTGPPVESDAEKPFLAFAVGTRVGVTNPDDNLPHHLWVWNDTDETRTVELSLTTGETVLIDDTYEIPAGKPLGVALRDPRPYEWTVRTDGREKVGTIARSRFDCNHSATDVLVREDELKKMTITTQMMCGTTTAGEE